MKKFKALYKGIYDDLKDAEMMINYACKIKENSEDAALADEIAKYANSRLNHALDFHKLLINEAKKQNDTSVDSVNKCLWEETHEMMQEWYNSIKSKVEKY